MAGPRSLSNFIDFIPLHGRVASFLNAREIAINIGSKQGVKEGMLFAVLAKDPIEVKDPVTGELLDQLDREKVRVKVIEVREKIAVCSTYRERSIHDARVLDIDEAFSPFRFIPEPVKFEDSSLPPPLEQDESFVKVNDRVVQVLRKDV